MPCLQVVIGCGDPNPLVAAAGIATLQSAGIQVALIGGNEQQQCYDINQEFMEQMKQQAAAGSS
jgi:diaminohydroxyphosphoribosylaminopyrimidine deaminase/5-amino-6-(5-phosphoribosylamino)uracil reductase